MDERVQDEREERQRWLQALRGLAGHAEGGPAPVSTPARGQPRRRIALVTLAGVLVVAVG